MKDNRFGGGSSRAMLVPGPGGGNASFWGLGQPKVCKLSKEQFEKVRQLELEIILF